MSNKTLQFRYQNKSITVRTNAGYLGSHHWCATGVIHCVLVCTNKAVPISDGTTCLRGRKPDPKDAHWLCLRLSSTLKSYHRHIHSKRLPERNQKRLNQQECCANHYALIFTWGCCTKLWDSNHTLQMCVWANGLAKCIFTQSKEKVPLSPGDIEAFHLLPHSKEQALALLQEGNTGVLLLCSSLSSFSYSNSLEYRSWSDSESPSVLKSTPDPQILLPVIPPCSLYTDRRPQPELIPKKEMTPNVFL